MGNFYATAVVADATQEAVAAEVRNVPAYVSPQLGSYVVVYPSLMSVGPPGASSLWRDISKSLHVAILAAAVFDDDVLLYELWVDGELKDHYVSDTAVSDPDAKRSGPEGGDPRVLCSVFKCSDVKRVTEVLNAARTSKYVFETDRHSDLADVLGLPKASVACGYEYIKQGEYPDGVQSTQLTETAR